MDKETEARTICREAGLTCRRHPTKKRFYQVIDRASKSVVIDCVTLDNVYRNCLSGFVSSYDPVKRTFDRGKMKNYELVFDPQ